MRRRKRRFGWLERFYLVVTLGIMLGGSMWLDSRGEVVNAVVTSRNEQIVHRRDPQGTWYRWYRLGVRFPASNEIGAGPTIDVSRERYDSLTTGDTIQVRYLSFFPLLARAANRSTLSAVTDAGSQLIQDNTLAPLVVWLVSGLATLWIASRIGVIAIVAAGLAWIGVAFPMFFAEPPRVVLASTATSARVESVMLVTKSPDRRSGGRRRIRRISSDAVRRLDQPYQVVAFRFVVPGWRDSVLAVDAVDSASVPGLTIGATLPIRYDPAAPRDARLGQGSRTFLERNRYHLLVPAVGCGLLGMLGAWGAHSRRQRRARGDLTHAEDRRQAVQTELRLSTVLLTTGLSLTAGELAAQAWKTNEVANPIITLTYIPKGQNAVEAQRKQPLRGGCKGEKVSGIGEDALYEACESPSGAVIITRKGTTDLLVQTEAKPATDPAAKATVIALTRAALAKVK